MAIKHSKIGSPEKMLEAFENKIAELKGNSIDSATNIDAGNLFGYAYVQRLVDYTCNLLNNTYDFYTEGTVDTDKVTFTTYSDKSAQPDKMLGVYTLPIQDIDTSNDDDLSDDAKYLTEEVAQQILQAAGFPAPSTINSASNIDDDDAEFDIGDKVVDYEGGRIGTIEEYDPNDGQYWVQFEDDAEWLEPSELSLADDNDVDMYASQSVESSLKIGNQYDRFCDGCNTHTSQTYKGKNDVTGEDFFVCSDCGTENYETPDLDSVKSITAADINIDTEYFDRLDDQLHDYLIDQGFRCSTQYDENYITVELYLDEGDEEPVYTYVQDCAEIEPNIADVAQDAYELGEAIIDAYTNSDNNDENGDYENLIDGRYKKIASKSVIDSDGFSTDYTMYKDIDTDQYIFMFGDKDIYEPDEDYADHIEEDEDAANSWFENYNGFEDEED